MFKITSKRQKRKFHEIHREQLEFAVFLSAIALLSFVAPQHVLTGFVMYQSYLMHKLLQATRNSTWY